MYYQSTYLLPVGVGGWKALTLHVPAPTDALFEIPIPNLVGGYLSSNVS